MVKIKEYVFKKKPETKLEEKKEIVIDKEEKKIIINSNKIHNEKLKSFYESKISLYNFLGVSLGLFGLFLLINPILYFFDSQITNLFINKNSTSLFGETGKSFLIGFFCLGMGGNIINFKVKKYEKLLKELKE